MVASPQLSTRRRNKTDAAMNLEISLLQSGKLTFSPGLVLTKATAAGKIKSTQSDLERLLTKPVSPPGGTSISRKPRALFADVPVAERKSCDGGESKAQLNKKRESLHADFDFTVAASVRCLCGRALRFATRASFRERAFKRAPPRFLFRNRLAPCRIRAGGGKNYPDSGGPSRQRRQFCS